MEKRFKLETDDGFIIYGTHNYLNNSEKVIIIAHGLTGHKNEHHFYNAARYFPKKGYGVVRFDFYNGGEKRKRSV